jgi:hypothetical protein
MSAKYKEGVLNQHDEIGSRFRMYERFFGLKGVNIRNGMVQYVKTNLPADIKKTVFEVKKLSLNYTPELNISLHKKMTRDCNIDPCTFQGTGCFSLPVNGPGLLAHYWCQDVFNWHMERATLNGKNALRSSVLQRFLEDRFVQMWDPTHKFANVPDSTTITELGQIWDPAVLCSQNEGCIAHVCRPLHWNPVPQFQEMRMSDLHATKQTEESEWFAKRLHGSPLGLCTACFLWHVNKAVDTMRGLVWANQNNEDTEDTDTEVAPIPTTSNLFNSSSWHYPTQLTPFQDKVFSNSLGRVVGCNLHIVLSYKHPSLKRHNI